MRTALVFAAALFAGCRSTSSPGPAPEAGGAQAELRGDPAFESQLEIAEAHLVHVPAGVEAQFVLRNRSGSHLSLHFLVQAFARSGVPLPDGKTAWVALDLGPHEGRQVRTATLPAETESWRLVTRK